jgi:hypothetical protein
MNAFKNKFTLPNKLFFIFANLIVVFLNGCVSNIDDVTTIRDGHPALYGKLLFNVPPSEPAEADKLIERDLQSDSKRFLEDEMNRRLQKITKIAKENCDQHLYSRFNQASNIFCPKLILTDDGLLAYADYQDGKIYFSAEILRKLYVQLMKTTIDKYFIKKKNPFDDISTNIDSHLDTPAKFLFYTANSKPDVVSIPSLLIGTFSDAKSQRFVSTMSLADLKGDMTYNVEWCLNFILAHECSHIWFDKGLISSNSEVNADFFGACIVGKMMKTIDEPNSMDGILPPKFTDGAFLYLSLNEDLFEQIYADTIYSEGDTFHLPSNIRLLEVCRLIKHYEGRGTNEYQLPSLTSFTNFSYNLGNGLFPPEPLLRAEQEGVRIVFAPQINAPFSYVRHKSHASTWLGFGEPQVGRRKESYSINYDSGDESYSIIYNNESLSSYAVKISSTNAFGGQTELLHLGQGGRMTKDAKDESKIFYEWNQLICPDVILKRGSVWTNYENSVKSSSARSPVLRYDPEVISCLGFCTIRGHRCVILFSDKKSYSPMNKYLSVDFGLNDLILYKYFDAKIFTYIDYATGILIACKLEEDNVDLGSRKVLQSVDELDN